MRHAMIMTVNDNTTILQMFIDLFDDERYDFYVLIDKKSPILNEEILKSCPKKSKLFFLPRINIFWGGYSQINAYLKLLEISCNGNYDYYHFFQGSDFPLKTKDKVDIFFEENQGKEFINIYKNNFAEYKCRYWHLFVEKPTYRNNIFLKAINHLCVKIQKVVNISRNKDIELFHGSALNSLSQDCVKYILQHRAEIEKRFRFSLGADEVFLQTIVANSSFADRIYRFDNSCYANCRFIDWNRRDGNSPYTFTDEDYEELMNADEGILFFRKVNQDKSMGLVKKIYENLKCKS